MAEGEQLGSNLLRPFRRASFNRAAFFREGERLWPAGCQFQIIGRGFSDISVNKVLYTEAPTLLSTPRPSL